MSKGEILYVKGMNASESEEDEEVNDEVWDDRKLNEAYDKALAIANAEVAKRIAMSTNGKTQKTAPEDSKNKKNKSNTKANSLKCSKKEPASSSPWKQGMPCRAVYDADGEEYEAFLLRFINEKECLVRFVGYENSEIVPIDELKPSLGSKERTKQIHEAMTTSAELGEKLVSPTPKAERMDCDSDKAGSAASAEKSHHKKKKSTKKKHQQKKAHFVLGDLPFPIPNMSHILNLGPLEMPLPPPPMPPALSHGKDSEELAVHSMLFSWYMSGYYTGLYQGMKSAKKTNRSHQ